MATNPNNWLYGEETNQAPDDQRTDSQSDFGERVDSLRDCQTSEGPTVRAEPVHVGRARAFDIDARQAGRNSGSGDRQASEEATLKQANIHWKPVGA